MLPSTCVDPILADPLLELPFLAYQFKCSIESFCYEKNSFG